MTLPQLVEWARDKTRFQHINDYANFSEAYLSFIHGGLQAVIVSKNENHYQFFQYKADGHFNVSRPVNSRLLLSATDLAEAKKPFDYALKHIREMKEEPELRQLINRFIYTCQQSIGVALDALPAGASNTARKINGDLFERYIRLIISYIGIDVRDGLVSVPVTVDNNELFQMSYQHDLVIEEHGEPKAIGSVKTSSKDRIDKIFIDKFLYNRLTGISTPHFAVFLNDVQRRGREPAFGINATFLTGHFKGYTVKLNPLDGVYYCDLRPNMLTDDILKAQIHPLDSLLVDDIWTFLE